jgi:hypothetical protein
VDVTVVYLNDAKIPYEQAEEYFSQAANWAKNQCASYMGYHVQDVSDVSYQYDFIAEYRFHDSKDAILFQIKYKNN